MRSVVLMMSVSVDGYVAGPHGHAGALPEPDELKRWKLDRIGRAGTHIMGRVTYQEMAGYWPTSTDDYAAAPMNEIPKVVFSKTLGEATWAGSSIARGLLGAGWSIYGAEGAQTAAPRRNDSGRGDGLSRSSPRRRAHIGLDQEKRPQPMTT
jgi:RibD C-terminal domain